MSKGLKDIFKKTPSIDTEIFNKKVEAFLADYRELVKKHGLDVLPQLQIVQVQIPPIQPIQALPIVPETK